MIVAAPLYHNPLLNDAYWWVDADSPKDQEQRGTHCSEEDVLAGKSCPRQNLVSRQLLDTTEGIVSDMHGALQERDHLLHADTDDAADGSDDDGDDMAYLMRTLKEQQEEEKDEEGKKVDKVKVGLIVSSILAPLLAISGGAMIYYMHEKNKKEDQNKALMRALEKVIERQKRRKQRMEHARARHAVAPTVEA